MEDLNSFEQILKRIISGTSTEEDIQLFKEAVKSGKISIVSGPESVALGGTSEDRVVITNNNTIVTVINQDNSQRIETILQLNKVSEEGDSTKDKQKQEALKSISLGFVSAFLVALVTVLLKLIFPDFDKDIIDLLSYGILLLIIGVFITLQKKQIAQRKRQFLFVSLTTFFITSVLIYFIAITFTERPTAYFIVDASENMLNVFPEVSPRLKLNTNAYPENIDLGMSVFGGELGGVSGCNDIFELVKPTSKKESLHQIFNAIDLLVTTTPRGPGNLQRAVESTILRLKGRKGLQRIVIITSNPSNSCEQLDSGRIEKIAKENKVEYQLVPLTVGDVPDITKKKLEEYASNKIYINTSVENLASAIETILNAPPAPYDLYYFGYYGYLNK